jgi:TRAP-type C4-dicarboxylate transport system substrate-binding protein
VGSMQWTKSRAGIAAIGLIPATVILVSACSNGAGVGNKAGPVDQPVVLRMADLNAGSDLRGTPEIQYFVQRVSDLSGGKMSVKVVYSVGGLAVNAEQQVVKDVAGGSFDLGFAGTGVFDTLGDPGFRALSAPMLIDSYPLENAVIRSSLPARMMAGLAKLDVTGLAVLGDEMRRPVGVRQPILSLADWRGITFGTYQSNTEEAAVRALGAKPGPGFATARDQALASGALQGFDLNLVFYHQLSQEHAAPYITANVDLWPRTVALFANSGRLARLSASQRRLVTRAAADAAVHSTGLFQDETPVVREICQSGGRLADASSADLQALRQRFAPVYASLEADPQTKAMIGQIAAMKRSTPAGPALTIPAGCTGRAPGQQASGSTTTAKLNGTYRWTMTAHDGTTTMPEVNSEMKYPSTFTATLRDGRWTMRHSGAETMTDNPGDVYSVQGDRIKFHWGDGFLTFTYSVDGQGNLHLTAVPPVPPDDTFVFTTHPWTKIG